MLHAGARSGGPQAGLPVLARNVTHFMRLLRDGGFALSPAHAIDALTALRLVDVGQRDEVRAALAALVLSGPDQRPLFDAAFDLFWRDPDWEGKLRALLLPRVDAGAPPPKRSNRLADALAARQPEMPSRPAQAEAERIHVPLTFSDQERLAQRDFETLSAQEWRALQHLVRTRRTHLALQRTRRLRAATCGTHADLRASARLAVRQHGEWLRWKFRKHAERKPPLVLLLDISGSMSQYSRAVLYFCHALMQSRERLAVFLFGTRLTNITRSLRERDPDEAVAVITGQVRDWAGGTRIGAALASFNRHWARRTLSGRATVLLVTDGLDHGTYSARRWRGCAALPTASSGSTRCCATPASRRRRVACRPSCRTSTRCGRPITWTACWRSRRCCPTTAGRPGLPDPPLPPRPTRKPRHGNEPEPAPAGPAAGGMGSAQRHRAAQAMHPGM
ncbi:hypothetical protein CBM2586_A10701 [Cupriavidus phytorum]|uniref:VWFA domain-containing protein n=1 Tax=Cupriavidus taiwanensis TaxID=164546 RepID=A0A375BAR5_9BURK|nr:hypothetical protein CBM2586_A10701 [Cupriavidus taiwanensis]